MTDIGFYQLDDDNNVIFSFKNIGRVVSGPEEALQVAAYHLFTTPGTNTYNRDEGGGLQSLLGKALTSKANISTQAAMILRKARASIIESQSENRSADATITDLKLLNVGVDKDTLTISLNIRIDLLDGNSFQATFRVT